MANRYGYQYNVGYKPKMVNIEGFVSIGTGGLPNSVVGISSGGQLASSGTYWGLLPGCATQGVPTGWAGTFSGAIGLYGAGVAGVVRLGTGLYSVLLSDDYVRLDSAQVQVVGAGIQIANGGQTGMGGASAIDAVVAYHTVGLGNSVTTGFQGASGLVSENLKDQIVIQFSNLSTACDLPLSSGFFLQLRLRDSLAGVQ